jgi:thiamine-monophosphate kinase
MPQAERLSGEFDYIAWIRRLIAPDRRVPIGVGDDSAALRFTPGRDVLVTVDMLLEGVHFDLSKALARQVGRKSLGVNLSDIAAMAGTPVAAVVGLGIPDGFARPDAEQLFHGIHQLAGEFDVALIGGDTNRSPNGLVISITLLGEANPRGAVRRDGARIGDWIMVTGSLGGSIHGKHLTFTPRVREAITLHERYELHAMIDISDGLAADLGHILQQSGCGGVLHVDAIPLSDAAQLGPGPSSPLDRALYDGEDFELLFTLAENEGRRLLAERPLEVSVSCIGQITSGDELLLALHDGTQRPIERRGYDHFRH